MAKQIIAVESTTMAEGFTLTVERKRNVTAKGVEGPTHTYVIAERSGEKVEMRAGEDISPNSLRSYLTLCAQQLRNERAKWPADFKPAAPPRPPESFAEFARVMALKEMFLPEMIGADLR